MDNIPAGYWLILCSCLLTVRYAHQHLAADVFLMLIRFCHSLTGAGHPDRDRNQISEFRMPDSSREQAVTSVLLLRYDRPLDVTHHLLTIIVVISCSKHVEYPYQLARHSYQ